MGSSNRRKGLAAVLTVLALCIGLLGIAAPAAQATHGTTNNYALNLTPYNFEDISTTGTLVPNASNCDDCTGTIPIGFTFNFYGVDYTNVNVSSNGFVQFTGTNNACCSGQPIPTPGGSIDNFIAAYWTDLRTDSTSPTADLFYQVLGTAPDRRLILQWEQVSIFGSTTIRETFQIKLFETSDVAEVHYKTVVSPNRNDISAGIENQDGTQGVQYFYDRGGAFTGDNVTLDNAAVCYDPGHGGGTCTGAGAGQSTSGRSIDCQPDSSSGDANTTQAVTCTVLDRNGQPLQYESVTFSTSGAGELSATVVETDNQGRATVQATSTTGGTQTITATITDDLTGNEPNEVDECDNAAGTPTGSIAGQCSDTVTRTWTASEPPPPPAEDEVASTDLTIDYRRGVFRGNAASSKPDCEEGRRVNLKKVRPGPDRKVGTTTTNADGNWSIAKPNARGRYYAVSPGRTHAQDDGGTLTCTRAVSNREFT